MKRLRPPEGVWDRIPAFHSRLTLHPALPWCQADPAHHWDWPAPAHRRHWLQRAGTGQRSQSCAPPCSRRSDRLLHAGQDWLPPPAVQVRSGRDHYRCSTIPDRAAPVPDDFQRTRHSDARMLARPVMIYGNQVRPCILLWVGREPAMRPSENVIDARWRSSSYCQT